MRMSGVRMAYVGMASVSMGWAGVAVVMIRRVAIHGSILPSWGRVCRRNRWLVGSLTRPALECIDAPADGCDDETSF